MKRTVLCKKTARVRETIGWWCIQGCGCGRRHLLDEAPCIQGVVIEVHPGYYVLDGGTTKSVCHGAYVGAVRPTLPRGEEIDPRTEALRRILEIDE